MLRKRGVGWAAAVLAPLLCLPLTGWATPSDEVREPFEQVITILATPALKPAEKAKERRGDTTLNERSRDQVEAGIDAPRGGAAEA